MLRAEARWLDSPPPGWDQLLSEDPNTTPAHRPELVAALAATLPGLTQRFAAVEDEHGRLIGGASVIIERRGGFHWIHALPFLLPGAPLARAGEHAEVDARVGRALAELQRRLRAVGGEWALYRPVGPEVEDSAASAPSGETRALESLVLELERGLEPLVDRMDRKTRKELRLAREAGLAFAEDPGALERASALHAHQARRWRTHVVMPPELSRRLLERAHPGHDPAARLFTVRDAGGLLCAAFALDSPRETMLWWSGAHPESRHRFAFPFLIWSIVEWAAAAGRRRVNLGASGGLAAVAAFKADFSARAVRYPVRWLDAQRASMAGRALAAIQRRMRRLRPRGEPA